MIEPTDCTPLRVLLVDDCPDMNETMALLLHEWGHDVCAAADGVSALAAADSFGPDVAFLDIQMPGLDGYEVARRLRARWGDRPLLLVSLSGYGHQADHGRSRAAGCDFHLVKPADPEFLRRLLSAWKARLLSPVGGSQ